MPYSFTENRKKSRNRKSERFSNYGREQEEKVRALLEEYREGGQKYFSSVELHRPNSPEDEQGYDLTVGREVDGQEIRKSFGITISLRSWQLGKQKHPSIPQFCFPINARPETIIRRVKSLFE
jgi:hypothetical protein